MPSLGTQPTPTPHAARSQAWCQTPACLDHPLVRAVHARAVNLTGVPVANAEFFQVVRYRPGQFYRVHHDQNTPADSLSGVRLLTFFVYLREPEAGGHTSFPRLGLQIPPRRGTALLWPNVRDDDLTSSDMRTEHAGEPPLTGDKYSANLWLHQFDFRGPNTAGCDLGVRLAVGKRTPEAEARAELATQRSRGDPVRAAELEAEMEAEMEARVTLARPVAEAEARGGRSEGADEQLQIEL